MGPISCPETSVITNTCCAIPQKSEILFYFAAQAYNHAKFTFYLEKFARVPTDNLVDNQAVPWSGG